MEQLPADAPEVNPVEGIWNWNEWNSKTSVAMTYLTCDESSAKNVAVSLSCSNQVVVLQVRDDGPGFQVNMVEARKRVGGLMSMRRRSEVIDRTFDVWSSPG